MQDEAVGYDAVEAAAARLAGKARRTPLLNDPAIDERAGCRVLIKAEPLQRTGSFKFRGAYNRISSLDAPAIVAYSSGNHAQGVAMAARMLGRRATIVMPNDAPRIKRDATRALGAEIVGYERGRDVREEIGDAIAAETGAVLVKPYDDPLVIAGQGTVGLEMAQQAREAGFTPELAVTCCGGGGLTAGIALALRHHFPAIGVFAAEPHGFDDHRRSLEAGERRPHPTGSTSICDALLAPMPGELTFALNRRLLAGAVTVTDEEVMEAMATAFERLKLVVEPGGAVALAAVLAGALDCRGKTVLVVLSGGNVDADLYARCLARARSTTSD
ncbi:MAG: threonine/serine dehydratase [Geminicoccaceae bacterium]|nr:threonine/serine dehydratase [Geminicoccaceae bacterium]